MKPILNKFFAVIAAIFIVTAAVTGCASSNNASSGKGKSGKSEKALVAIIDRDAPLPFNPAIKTGTLENGMTYYILKNSEPQNRIFLRLAVKAGSVMEEENELGVAHFIEHLAFNGTEHFQKSEIVDWFEKIGMNFGGDLNAYTSFEETVYMLEIPADDPEMLKTAMLVLHDWASAVTFPQEEIDKERGVVQEEWRSRFLNVNGRMANQIYPFITKDSVFENHMAIGSMDVINNITRDEIVNFYKKWYRPELMSVIVVGDAEVSAIENEIKNTMGVIPASENPISVSLNRIPLATEKKILYLTDPEFKYPTVNIYTQQEKSSAVITQGDLFDDTLSQIAANIFNIRMNEITNTADSKWFYAGIGVDNFTKSDSFPFLAVLPKEGTFMDSIKGLFDEYDRAVTFGVTEEELQMLKNALRQSLQNMLDNKDKTPSDERAGKIANHFLTGEAAQSIEDAYNIYQNILDAITVEDVNEFIKKAFENRGIKILVRAPENYADLPTEEELMDVWKNHKNDSISAYTSDSIEKLMDKPAKKGKIKSQKKNKELGTTEYTLENGIKIITKKTDFTNDEIIMQAGSKGGHYQISDEDFPSYNIAVDYVLRAGFNGFTYNQWNKFLADKTVSFRPAIDYNSETITGSSNNKDFVYLLQCVNLMFTARQHSDDAWKVLSDDYEDTAKKHGMTPNDAYNDKIRELVFGKGDLRHAPFDMEKFEKINIESAEKILNERFANPADFTFVFVGDFDEKKLIELCQFYLGTLPTTPDREETKYLYWPFPKGKIVETVQKGIDDKGQVFMMCGGELPPQESMEAGFKEAVVAEQLASLLSIRLREVIREDKGGTYGVGGNGTIDGYPERFYKFQVTFACQPDREEELSEAVLDTIREIQTTGVSDDNIQKLREAYRREHETNLRNNWWWLGKINAVSVFEYQPDWVVSDTEKVCSLITSDALQEAAKKYLDTENYVCVFLKPEK